MASCKSVVVVCSNARRQTVKVGPTTTILQILEEVCKKQGLSSQENAIKHQKKILDETLPIRYSGLSNNAHLELVPQTKVAKEGVQCTIALQLANGLRLLKDFPPAYSLWDVVGHWNSEQGSPHHNKLLGQDGEEVVCVYMTQRMSGEAVLKTTTLHSLGLTGTRAIIRLLHEQEKTEVAVSEEPKSVSKEQTRTESPPFEESAADTTNYNKSSTTQATSHEQHSTVTNIGDKDRRLSDTGTVSSDVGASDPKRTRITGPEPLFPDFKFPAPKNQSQPGSSTQTGVSEERLQHLATPCDRCPVVFRDDDETLHTPQEDDPPDSFYNVTVEDLRKMLQGLQSDRAKSTDGPLMTKAMRENRRLEEVCKYDKVAIRIKFPDRLTLQGFFRPQEKVSVLTEFVKSHLEDPNLSFYLYTTPPRVLITNQDHTLFEAQLCPASLVYFGSSVKKDRFLGDNLLSNLCTALDAEKTVLQSGIRSSTVSSILVSASNGVSGHAAQSADAACSTERTQTQRPMTSNAGKTPKWFKGTGK